MRAIVVDRWMEPRDLGVREVPEPELGPGTLAVEVRAAGCNFFDILMVRGHYQVKPPFPFIPGAELAGVVRAVGAGVEGFAVGDRVLATVPLGAFAERAVVPARGAWQMPESMSFEEGASFPIVYPTSYAGLVFRAGLRRGETLLVHAAAGGVGIAAVQIGKALGARVIATAGGAEKLAVARRAGAEVAIDYRSADWVEQVRAATDGRGADVIYDPVGGDIFDLSTKCIAPEGRLLVVGFAGGRIPSIQANRILLKDISIVGVHWGAYVREHPEYSARAHQALEAMYKSGQIRPQVGKRYRLDEAPAGLKDLAQRKVIGKAVLVM